MKKKSLLIIALTSMCAVTGTMVFANRELSNSYNVFANGERPVNIPYVMNITNFTEHGFSTKHFVAKTETGYDIKFRCDSNQDFSQIDEDKVIIPAGYLLYNDTARGSEYGDINNAINQMTSLTVTFSGQLKLNAKWFDDDYTYMEYAVDKNLTSGVAFNFLATYTEGQHLPNVIELEAAVDTTITSIRIEYLCHN